MNKARRWKRRARKALVAKCVEYLTSKGYYGARESLRRGPWRVTAAAAEMTLDDMIRAWRRMTGGVR